MLSIFNKCINLKLYKNQFISVILVNILVIGYGSMLGWLSPYLPVYLSDETPLKSGKITINELSWISAYSSIGCLIGNFLAGYISNNYGRKLSIFLLGIPNIASYLLVIFATNVYYLYGSQILAGLTGGGAYVAIPLFVAEIAQPKFRGLLLSIIIIFNNIGIIITFILGIYLSSITSCIILPIVPILFMISIIFLPETPQYLLKRNKLKKATHSLAYYRNCSDFETNVRFIEELEILKINAIDSNKSEDVAGIKDLFKPLAIKGVLIGIVLTIMNPFCGCLPFIAFTSLFIAKSGSDLDPNKSAVFVMVLRFIGIYVTSILVDRIGRKKLLIISTVLMICALLPIAIFSYLYSHGVNLESYQFLPIVGISFAIFVAGFGVIGIPMVVVPEVLPKNVLSIGVTISEAAFSISGFITLKVIPILIFEIEVNGCMIIFIVFCILGLLFIIFVVPETKGKNLEIDEPRISD